MVKKKKTYLDYVFTLYSAMQEDNLGHIYRGKFTQEITDGILSLTETNLQKEEESPKIKKRVYAIMVECLQNITRHQDDISDSSPENYGLFVIQKQESKYFITTGNLIENQNIANIKNLIQKINSLEKEELKEYYKKVLIEGSLSSKGGAGLGLIDMARKSGNKLRYEFKPIANKFSYFYLHTIPSLPDLEETIASGEDSLENIMKIHNVLNDENILLVFNGIFNQESMINLLSTIQGQMSGSETLKKKVFYIIVEMLQNIVKHADKRKEDFSGSPGLFFISEKQNQYIITTGNYILNNKIESLKNNIEKINNLSKPELEKYYNDLLLDFEKEGDSKKTGLGIIDIRIKSGNKIIYSFDKIDNQFSFFTLQTDIVI